MVDGLAQGHVPLTESMAVPATPIIRFRRASSFHLLRSFCTLTQPDRSASDVVPRPERHDPGLGCCARLTRRRTIAIVTAQAYKPCLPCVQVGRTLFKCGRNRGGVSRCGLDPPYRCFSIRSRLPTRLRGCCGRVVSSRCSVVDMLLLLHHQIPPNPIISTNHPITVLVTVLASPLLLPPPSLQTEASLGQDGSMGSS